MAAQFQSALLQKEYRTVDMLTNASYRLGRGYSRVGEEFTHDIRRESYVDNITVRKACQGTTVRMLTFYSLK
jgi:hypothetical protein